MTTQKVHNNAQSSFSSAGERSRNSERPGYSQVLIQAKLTIGEPGDIYEKEADAMADTVMRMPEPGKVQRKCAGCEKEEKENLQMKPFAGSITRISRKESGGSGNTTNPDVESGINRTRCSGSKLPEGTRSFMESRFGADFSGVSIHTGSESVQMNRELNAQAFTVGNDVHFNQGKYNPSSDSGKHLLAHELTHTIQQAPFGSNLGKGREVSKSGESKLQRMTIGVGTPPARFAQFNGRAIPKGDTGRITKVIALIKEVADNPDSYSSCHEYFKTTCPTKGRNSLSQMFNNAILWKADKADSYGFTWPNTNDIAYTKDGYNEGETGLAGTLIHELLHTCGVSGKGHYKAEVASSYCIGGLNEISLAVGSLANANIPYLLFSYRRFLKGIGNGQLQITLGADLNLFSGGLLSGSENSTEIGSIMTGLKGRTNLLWGGEKFGGLTGKLELGASLGKFKVIKEINGGTREEGKLGPGFVVQAGIGAEFYIPIGVKILPLSLEATYRLVQPLNSEAEKMHGMLFSIGVQI